MRMVWSSLAASAVLLVAGTAFPGSGGVNQLVDFNQSTGELWAIPSGATTPATYLHDASTSHGIADLKGFTPPDPCRGLAEAWNATVRYENTHEGQTGRETTFVFEVLLTLMSDFKCNATLTTSTSGTPSTTQTLSAVTPSH